MWDGLGISIPSKANLVDKADKDKWFFIRSSLIFLLETFKWLLYLLHWYIGEILSKYYNYCIVFESKNVRTRDTKFKKYIA